MLYLCATPIGNLGDITLRVLETLKSCSLIAAEDTRHTRGLLTHYDIHRPLISYHEHNKTEVGPVLLERLQKGEDIALVTDAGMPGISDPGSDLVRLCRENGVPVTVLPGASAGVTALVLSGLDTRRFAFEGFLPTEKKERRQRLEVLPQEDRTMIFYEAPHRILETLQVLLDALGDREAATVRELTKKFEEVRRGTLSELLAAYTAQPPKGEFVLLVAGLSRTEKAAAAAEAWKELTVQEHMAQYLAAGLSEKDAMKQVARDRGVGKRDIYKEWTVEKCWNENKEPMKP